MYFFFSCSLQTSLLYLSYVIHGQYIIIYFKDWYSNLQATLKITEEKYH